MKATGRVVRCQYKLVIAPVPETQLKAQSPEKLQWDLLVIVCSVYQALEIPVQLSFDPDFLKLPICATIDSCINLIFIADIFIRIRTTHIDSTTGEEVTDGYSNAVYYIFTATFVIDVLSTTPWDVLFPDNSILPLLGFLKILRVGRMDGVISNLNSSKELKSLLKIGMLLIIIVIYINCCSALWAGFVSDEEEWIPNKDFVWVGTPQVYEYYYMTWHKKLLVSWYIGFYLFAVGEVCPRTTVELSLAIPMMIISSIANGIIIGNMQLYLVELSAKKSAFQSKMDTVNTALSSTTIQAGEQLTDEINDFFYKTHQSSTMQ